MKCQAIVGKHQARNNLQHQCERAGRYLTEVGYYCSAHLKKVRAFSKDPTDLKTGKRIDRDILYREGKIIEKRR